jgi:UDP-glucose 4-epimerase
VVGDLLDKAMLARVFAQHDIAAVMHFAAASLVGESMADPQKYYLNNVAGTLSLLAAMREAGCHRLVFSSTGAVYGQADSKALPETYSCAPINTYGALEMDDRAHIADYRSAYGLGAFCLRYFDASGADVAGGIGELRENETHLIPRAMMALQDHLADFAVFGEDYATPDGTAIRDYIHVTDLGAAHVAALKLLMQGHAGGAFNLGKRLFGPRDSCGDRRRDWPRSPPCRQAAAAGRSGLSGRRPHRRAQSFEFYARTLGSGDHRPHRMGLAPKGPPVETRVSPSAANA